MTKFINASLVLTAFIVIVSSIAITKENDISSQVNYSLEPSEVISTPANETIVRKDYNIDEVPVHYIEFVEPMHINVFSVLNN